jgi:hypothetical protein
MTFLFAVASPEYLRYYDSTLRLLAERGHDVAIAVNHVKEQKAARFDGVSDAVRVVGLIPEREDRWSGLARAIRGTQDFARYLHPRYADAPALRDRMKRKVLPRSMRWLDRFSSLGEGTLSTMLGALARAERGVPVSARLVAFLERNRPDVLVVSPLIDAASDQVDLVRAARHLGIRVAVGIASWDNLTNKGLLRVEPDLILVWNEAQKAEAVALHSVDPAIVAVTGAQLFDRWFDRRPSTTRERFCAMVGLPADRPFVLYTGSSVFIARSELELPFVRRWLAALRSSAIPEVRELGVLVRPHPYNWHAWEKADFSEFATATSGVAVWPRGPYNAVDEANRDGFFDSMYHSAAVVGVNTSAMVESAIVGRPVFSLTGEFGGTQEGTLHFHHLLPENGGFLRVARTLDEHMTQLASVMRNPEAALAETRRFVASFIRPHGVERPATPIVVERLEQFGATPAPEPRVQTAADRGMRLLLLPVSVAINRFGAPKKKGKGAKPAKAIGSGRGEQRGKPSPVEATARAAGPRDAFKEYKRVRDAVVRIRAAEQAQAGDASTPSAYWFEELGNIDYLIEASPLIIAKLRHHAFHITGLRPYDYRTKHDEKRSLFEQRLKTLTEMSGQELIVPEHPALGGFGYEIDGKVYNLDTLKFIEVLVGMKRAGVLEAFAPTHGRRVAWEIGGGWGGFAYQFKTLFPDTTYVITDFPELFLFSATYLRTVLPEARTLIWEPGLPQVERDRWRDYDFVFVPNMYADALPNFSPDLLTNIASFQEMTSAQVSSYAALAARGRCPVVYSLNRERSPYNAELSAVSELLAAHYDLTDVSPLETPYTSAMKKPPRVKKTNDPPKDVESLAYRHLVGRLRAPGRRAAREREVAAAR